MFGRFFWAWPTLGFSLVIFSALRWWSFRWHSFPSVVWVIVKVLFLVCWVVAWFDIVVHVVLADL